MIAVRAEEVQKHLEIYGLMPKEQEGKRGTEDQLLIDKMIVHSSKRRKTNKHMTWLDYKKAF